MLEGTEKLRTGRVEGEIHYLLSFEEKLLHAISTRAPLPKILNGICSALDCQIGKVISLISVTAEDACEFAPIAMEAALFGLHTFHSERVIAPDNEVLGSLEMYCCVPRCPAPREFQLIQRAVCLAAIAIKLENEGYSQCNPGRLKNRPGPGSILNWPVLMN